MAVKLYIGIKQNSYNKSTKKSNVKVSVTCSWTGGSWNHTSPSGWVKIDGKKYTFKASFNKKKSKSGTCTLYTKTVDVTHNSNGSKTLTCSAQYNSEVSSGVIKASVKKALGTSVTSSSSKKANSNKVKIEKLDLQNNTDNTVFVTWSWSKSHTDNYKVRWYYATGDDVWFIGNDGTETFKQSTYSAPSNAYKVKVSIKPISKKHTVNKKETSYWTADWASKVFYISSVVNPPTTPPVPSIDIDISDFDNDGTDDCVLNTELDNLDVDATHIAFQIVRDNASVYKTGTAEITTSHAAFSCKVDTGHEYKARCRSYKIKKGKKIYSEWSEYTSSVSTIPAIPSSITTIRANSKTSVYLEWSEVEDADTYDIEYTTKKEYFDGSNQTTTINGIEFTHYEITGMETGYEYFFRVRAVNENGASKWSDINSVIIGTDPAAPTTWASSTTVIVGEPLILYWVHNSEDGSSQTSAKLELNVDGVVTEIDVPNSTDEEEKDKTSFYEIDTSEYDEGAQIKWRVKTAGVLTTEYGEWSIQRVVDIYAQPTLDFGIFNAEGTMLDTIESFPFYARAEAGPTTQKPIGYHIIVTSAEIYETIDDIGNSITVNEGEEIYSKYFDIDTPLDVVFSANNIDLETDRSYTITCSASMDSGLTVTSSIDFNVEWIEEAYLPNAEISIDEETLTASIRPYCEVKPLTYYKVNYDSTNYVKTDEILDELQGERIEDVQTTTGENVYVGILPTDNIYYCETEEPTTFYYEVNYDSESKNYIVGEEITKIEGLPLGDVTTTTGEEVYWSGTINYCMIEGSISHYFKVSHDSSTGTYTKTSEELPGVDGEIVENVQTTTGEEVYFGVSTGGENVYFCTIEGESEYIDDVVLSVYRREFDGSFTELIKNVANNTCIQDPHPSLDYARYRVVATTESTGAISFYDVPGYPVGGKAVVIQWGESWSNFDTTNEDALEQPAWSGSLLKLPYNIDVSDSRKQDVDLVEYIGRKRPVSYYGTQLGESATWNVEIAKSDIETLYAIRRLSIWMGDVYIREPSGSGYWANISVSYSQKHCDLTIPITLSITRVEGGI